jgi:hypothetical protein
MYRAAVVRNVGTGEDAVAQETRMASVAAVRVSFTKVDVLGARFMAFDPE